MSDGSEAPGRGLSSERALVWMRRLMWTFGAIMATFVAMLVAGWPTMWIAPASAFLCAEITRRISAEGNPEVRLRWRDLLSVLCHPADPDIQRKTTRYDP